MLLNGLLKLRTEHSTHIKCVSLCENSFQHLSGECVTGAHPLDALFVDADPPEQSFEDLAEHESKEADGAELQTVCHLLQDGRHLLLDFTRSSARLFGKLENYNTVLIYPF